VGVRTGTGYTGTTSRCSSSGISAHSCATCRSYPLCSVSTRVEASTKVVITIYPFRSLLGQLMA